MAYLPHPQGTWLDRWPKADFVVRIFYQLRGRVSAPLASNVHWGDAVWLLFAVVCRRQRRFRYTIPVLLLTVFTSLTRFNVYHGGLFWVLFLFLWWVNWPGLRGNVWNVALMLAACGCTLSQCIASFQAVHYDVAQPYSPDRDGAVVLQRYIQAGQRVDLAVPPRVVVDPHEEFLAVGLEPYFAREPISNMRARFWLWTPDDDMRATYLHDVATHSAVILLVDLGNNDRSDREAAWLQQQDYRKVQAVCGRAFYPAPAGIAAHVCHTFYEPMAGSGAQ